MAYSEISKVAIALQTSGVTRQGFGTLLFLTDDVEAGFTERVRSYTSAQQVAEDVDVGTLSSAYQAALAHFSPTPSPAIFKIGRIASAEAPAVALAAVRAEDDDFYILTTDVRVSADIEALADLIEASRKMFFVSTNEAGAYSTYTAGAATDILGILRDGNYFRTKGMYHHESVTKFPEVTYAAYNLPYLAGSVSWTNLQLPLSAAQISGGGALLTVTQKNNLEARNAAYTELVGGVVVQRNGRVASGEKIDVIRGRDNLEVDLNADLTNLLINQQGSKLPYTNAGINRIYNLVRTRLNQYSEDPRNFISKFTMDFKLADQVPTADKQAGIYRSGTFKAELQGAIELIEITGVLTLELA